MTIAFPSRRAAGALTFFSFTGLCAATITPAQAQATLTTIASFSGPINGAYPNGSVTFDSSGNLFGTARYGGANNDGTVFEIAHGSTSITTLASFNRMNGANPYSGATFDSQGNLFGTTNGGGDANGDGTVFEIAHGSTSITTLASFTGTGIADNGSTPTGVTFDSSGNLFGTTLGGGASFYGTVYKIAAGTTTVTTLASFNGVDGYNPSRVTFDSQGNLFGTTSQGGVNNDGTVFEVAKGSATLTTLASFNSLNGSSPESGVTFDSQGNLFGTTKSGGASISNTSPSGYGTVYEIAKGSTAITDLASFTGTNGASPFTGVTFDSQGNLFGTTSGGATGYGTVYEIAKGSTAITTLASFNGLNGDDPDGGVTFDSQGNLFGTTLQGGVNGDGTVYEIAGAGFPAAVPEASTTVSLGLLLTLGGIALARRKRTQNAVPDA